MFHCQDCVYLDESFLDDSKNYYEQLRKDTKWEKTPKINRWVSLYVEGENNYKYRDAPGAATVSFPPLIKELKERIETWYFEKAGKHITFNVCLLNFYESGDQRIGWHSDREEIGRTTPIASLSLGATRSFLLRSRQDGINDRVSLSLKGGSLVIMENKCQLEYLHSVPREPSVKDGRINLTFRCKGEQTEGELEHERRDDWLDRMTSGATPSTQAWSREVDALSSNPEHDVAVFGDGVKTIDTNGKPICLLVKTNLGAEGYCAAEVEEVLSKDCNTQHLIVARPLGMDGYVGLCGDSVASEIKTRLLQLKSAHHVLEYHTHFDIAQLVTDEFPEPKLVDGETLYQYFKKCLVEGIISIPSLEKASSFRVTCERIGGPHAFQGHNVERCVIQFPKF